MRRSTMQCGRKKAAPSFPEVKEMKNIASVLESQVYVNHDFPVSPVSPACPFSPVIA